MPKLLAQTGALFAWSRCWTVCAACWGILLVGCWQEVHYKPSDEPAAPPDPPVVLKSEPPQEIAPPAEVPKDVPAEPSPTADDLFANEDGELSDTAPESTPAPSTDEMFEETSEEPEPPVTAPEIAEPKLKADATTALAAWRLGSKWSLALGIFGKGYGPDRYGGVWEQAVQEAQALDVDLPPLPAAVGADELATRAAHLVLEETGPAIAADLGSRLSREQQALFDLAAKKHALLLIYTPDGSEVKPVIAGVRLSAEFSGLPEDMLSPLMELLDSRAEFADVKQAVFQLHREVEAHLAQQASP